MFPFRQNRMNFFHSFNLRKSSILKKKVRYRKWNSKQMILSISIEKQSILYSRYRPTRSSTLFLFFFSFFISYILAFVIFWIRSHKFYDFYKIKKKEAKNFICKINHLFLIFSKAEFSLRIIYLFFVVFDKYHLKLLYLFFAILNLELNSKV